MNDRKDERAKVREEGPPQLADKALPSIAPVSREQARVVEERIRTLLQIFAGSEPRIGLAGNSKEGYCLTIRAPGATRSDLPREIDGVTIRYEELYPAEKRKNR